MAGLETTATETNTCCSPAAQETCCEPEAKSACCGDGHGSGCGCSAGGSETTGADEPGEAQPTETGPGGPDVREAVRERYAAAAVAGDGASSLGCGNPTAVADLRQGETVLDLGSGGGIDVLLSARRVGPAGKAYGLDITDEMLDLARRNQRRAGIANAEFIRGTIEDVPLPDASVDVIVSNCVINLSPDKPAVFREAARVLRPGGRLAVSDVVADPGMDEATRRDLRQWTGCIAGALTRDDFERELVAAGFESVEIRETHRVHEHAASAIVRAQMPGGR